MENNNIQYTSTDSFYYKDSLFMEKDDIIINKSTHNYQNITKGRSLNVLSSEEEQELKSKLVLDTKVNHPSHYNYLKDLCGIEVIDITRHMDFDLGNAVKYILRSGHKSEQGYSNVSKQIEDLQKAIWYINDEIKLLQQK
jgi:hypothetical protein